MKKDDAEAIRIMHRSKNYVLIDDKLYKRGAGSGVLMKCVTTKEGKEILQEAHEGTCGNHATCLPWLVKSSDQDFIGQQHYQMQKHSSNDVKDASTSPNIITCLLKT